MKLNNNTKLIIDGKKIENFNPECNINLNIDFKTPEDKIEYVHEISITVAKNSNADKQFKTMYKLKQQVKQIILPNISLPFNDTDYINMSITSRQRGNIGNTYVLSIITHAGSDTWKYLNERTINEFQKNS